MNKDCQTKVIIRYVRDHERKPVVTQAFVINPSGEYARGTAVCSKHDNPDKRIGRLIAIGRALEALKDKKSKESPYAHGKISHPWFPQFFKAEYRPDPQTMAPVEMKALSLWQGE